MYNMFLALSVIVIRTFIIMLPAMEQTLADHEFKHDPEIETVVTRCLITAILTGTSKVRVMLR